MTIAIRSFDEVDALVKPLLRAARIPGAAIAIVIDGEIVFARGYGYRDLATHLPVTERTVYPIASTSKAINATLLGMLVDEGTLAWDAPVQTYLPHFRLKDPLTSMQVTVRDLVTLRTGLPRHDWMRTEEQMDRAELVRRLRYLDLSAGLRERFQYNNLTVTVAGHIAEVVTGRSWEDLVRTRIFEPLGMNDSGCSAPEKGEVTLGYHENSRRELQVTQRLETSVTAPSGGAIHSTIADMARWVAFNLGKGDWRGRTLIQPRTLAEIHSPQVIVPPQPGARKSNARYALGWTVDCYNGSARLSHGGYLHDVSSEIVLFPQKGIGIVSFVNFGPTQLPLLINEQVFDLLDGRQPVQDLDQQLAQYEDQIAQVRRRIESVRHVAGTAPSHPLEQYAGAYVHPGYGKVAIDRRGDGLILRRGNLTVMLEHWHYDAWATRDAEGFVIHLHHPFDPCSKVLFESDADGGIAAVCIRLEPAVDPIRFAKQSD